MRLVTEKYSVRLFYFVCLVVGSYNFLGQSLSFGYVQGYFGVTAQDATWLLRGFQAGTIITSIAGLVFIKWLGNRLLFISSVICLLVATICSMRATEFNILLISRIGAGLFNGFMIAVATQLFLATYEGKAKMLGALYTTAANICGLCLGILMSSFFTEDYGWQFNYYLSLPVLFFIMGFSFFFVPAKSVHEEIEEDWISLIPFAILIVSLFFIVLFRQQYQDSPKLLVSIIIALCAICILLIRGFTHQKPLFDTRLLQYPGFILALVISFLVGAFFIFNVSLLAKLMGGILQMPMNEVLHFFNFLCLTIFISLIITLILLARKFNPFWLMITGLLAIAYTSFSLSRLNPEFSLTNIISPALIGMGGAGMIATSIIVLAVKSVPAAFAGKVANFRSVAFTLGIALTATDLGRLLDLEKVRNFNQMVGYTDAGNPLFQERLNGLKAFYQGSGLDADQAYDAAINGLTGMVKLQSFFLSVSETLFLGSLIGLVLVGFVFVLWLARNHQGIFHFITFKKSGDGKLES